MTLPFDLNLLDVLLLALMAIFAVRGAFRGLLEEITGLVGILVGIWLAGRYYALLGQTLFSWTGSSWSNTAAYVIILCGALVAVSLVSRLIHSFLKLTYADWLNHLAGAAVGGLKGVALCAVIVTLLNFVLANAPIMRESRLVPPINTLVSQFKGYLPHDFLNS